MYLDYTKDLAYSFLCRLFDFKEVLSQVTLPDSVLKDINTNVTSLPLNRVCVRLCHRVHKVLGMVDSEVSELILCQGPSP